MKSSTHTFSGKGGKAISAYRWEPEIPEPRGVVQIVHGIAEHAGRYRRVAEQLTEEGFAVTAHDHRGHGNTERVFRGHIAGNDGYHLMVDDVHTHYLQMMKRYGELPRFLLGHSMGETIVLRALQLYPIKPDGVILSGSLSPRPGLLREGALLAGLLGLIFGRSAKSPLINRLIFGPANSHFKPARTPFDWLTSDYHEVNKFINDPACGFTCSYSFYKSFFNGIRTAHKKENIKQIDPDIPFYLFSGTQDHFGDMGEGVKELAQLLREAGVENLTVKLYEDGRHEMLNETNRDEVTGELIRWLETNSELALD